MVGRETAEIICMNCGRLLGEVERRGDALRLVHSDRPALLRIVGGRLECQRCGGRGFIEGRMLVA